MKKLAVIITHPIQYYVPVFRLLAKQCQLKVFYTWGAAGIAAKHDPGFGKTIAWDLPLLEGYDYELVDNVASQPGSHHGKGIINPALIAKIAAFTPHAILVYGYIYHSHFQVMRHFKGKTPIWFRGDSTLLDQQPGVKAIIKKLYLTWVYRYVDKAFYVGSNNKAYFKKYGLKDHQLIFAPHAIDNERFVEDRSLEVAQLRHSLGIQAHDLLMVFAGKLEPKKNPALLLEAFISWSNEQQTTTNDQRPTTNEQISPPELVEMTGDMEMTGNRELHLLFVGNGVLEESLKLKVESLKMKNIHFIDFQNQTQMPVVYQTADIFCLPSQGPGETWGLAINEAMAAGKAVIVSDQVGCGTDLVKNGVNGYIFRSNDQKDLMEKLNLMLKQDHQIATFGQTSQKIIKNWSFEQQVLALMKVLHETN